MGCAARTGRTSLRRLAIVPACAVLLAVLAAPAQASVLINAPYPLTKRCGQRITLGVWHRADGVHGSRRVRLTIRRRGTGHIVFVRRVRAVGHWRFWHYRPACGHRYTVRYTNARFSQRFHVRVRR